MKKYGRLNQISKKIIKNIKKNKLSTKIYKYYFVQIVYNIVTLKGFSGKNHNQGGEGDAKYCIDKN